MGNQSFLGKWDVSKGVKLQWSEGNEWSVTSQVPVGVDVSFKVSSFRDNSRLAYRIVWGGGILQTSLSDVHNQNPSFQAAAMTHHLGGARP